jgi:hypothetical protein
MIDPYFGLYTDVILRFTTLFFSLFFWFLIWQFFRFDGQSWGRENSFIRLVCLWLLSDKSPTFKRSFIDIAVIAVTAIILVSYGDYIEARKANVAYTVELQKKYEIWAKEYPINYEVQKNYEK